MYLSARMFSNHLELVQNGILTEFEYEDGGILLRVTGCKPQDGHGTMRLDGDLQPQKPRQMYMSKMNPPYRMRAGMMYDLMLSAKFSNPLPDGVRGVVELSNATSAVGILMHGSPKWSGEKDGLLHMSVSPIRIVEMDALFPIGVLRFVKLNTQAKKKKDDEGGDD